MKKRVISLIIMIALIITVFSNNIINKGIDVSAEEFRNGYALIPQKYDSTGIDTKTTFLLKTEDKKLTVKEVQEEFKTQDDIKFNVIISEKDFIISLEKELEKNNIYTFSFRDSVWTFQTTSEFTLFGVLPRNESTNVPINTGIEFYFSHEGVDIKDFFEIKPTVEGNFEQHGKTVVFAPKGGLKPKTIYTITLKKDLQLNNSDKKLLKDYTFSFETSPKENEEYMEQGGYFNFKNIINEFGTKEANKIPLDYYIYDKKNADKPIKVDVYNYKSIDDFASDINKFNQVPKWSYYGSNKNKVDIKNLSKVMSYNQPINKNSHNQQTMDLPQKLPKGFYIVDCNWEDINFQTFIQVTDLSYYYIGATNRGLVWLNDLNTGKPVTNATINEYKGTKTYRANNKGVVEITTNNKEEKGSIYKISAGNQRALLVDFINYNNESNGQNYWKYFQTDRGLYKPDDNIMFWGFVQNRYDNEIIDELSVEITESRWHYFMRFPYPTNDMAYEKETIKVENGFYDGTIKLPNLDEGSYQVSVKYKDNIISTNYIEVKDYIKPAYKLEMSKDKKAVMLNEKITFDINTLFFEGTPVSNLEVNYNINANNFSNGMKVSDVKGNSKVEYTPKYSQGQQGIINARINAYAKLPESGQIYGNEQFRIFINDINVNIESKRKEKEGTLSVKVNKYDISRLNDGTAKDHNDYLGEAVANKKITGTIYRNEWKRKEVGEYYDFINKVVKKRYDYYKDTTKVKDISLTTDKDGKAELKVNFQDIDDSYYTVELHTNDLQGRKMRFENYFSESYKHQPYAPNDEFDRYVLKAEKEEYNVNEQINMEFVNNDKALREGTYLYIVSQNGIKEYDVTSSSKYSKDFDKSYIPNVDIRGVYFNGKTYIQSQSFIPRLNTEKNKIVFTADTDKENYKPGEECTVNLKASLFADKNIPVKDIYVNVSLVDEALLKLNEHQIDTLEELYTRVNSGINGIYISHTNQNNNMISPRYGMFMEKGVDSARAEMSEMRFDAVTNDKQSANVYVRSVFKDTAIFKTIKLNEKGEGTFTFTLPDNVTSWRMTFAGISKSLQAGTDKQELIVSLPYFISTNLNRTYLVGDKPFIGVSAYGKELKEGEKITYEVTAEGTNHKVTATGKAFERVNIPLWEMKEGSYNIIVKAISESGHSDGLKQTIKVVKTYHEMQTADYYDLVKGMKIKTNNKGITKLMIVDKGRGKFLPELYSINYNNGKRVDQKYLAYKTSEILTNVFGVEDILKDEVKLSDYNTDDGGYGILPYAESDIETTVKLLPIIKDEINKTKVKLYLYNELNDRNSRNKLIALYGLALLDEPVLLELQNIEKISNLNLKDYIYLALAYSEIGDNYKANVIYEEKIIQYVEEYKTIKRIKYGNSEDKYLEYSALMMLLASNLNMNDKDLYYEYVSTTYSDEILVNSELLTYITKELNKVSDVKPKVVYTYEGETKDITINNGWAETIEIPSSKLNEFTINSVEGDASLVAIYNKQLVNINKQDNNIKVSKSYYDYATGKKTNTFNQSDIVKVVIDVDIDKKAIDNYYVVTDFAPSGLVPIESTYDYGFKGDEKYYCYRDVEGQKVTLYVVKDSNYNDKLYYYARVITPGTYKADGTIVQGSKIKDSFKISSSDEIKIKE
ncbi:MAG: Ig-like domain-containing protein [Vallitalea sp.]|jgi:hypothetical protein|nr:Ig-like domain-containing protein [Vallitalea sp.]